MASKYLLGFDVGSSSVKASLVNADSGKCVASAFYPEKEAPIMAVKAGWAEQDPQMWWNNAKLALKKIKQQILAFCLRHNYCFTGNKHWTQAHLRWLRELKLEDIYQEILEEYLLTYSNLTDKLVRLDKRIEELAAGEEYAENVHKLSCLLGIKTQSALSVLTETGDFNRFGSAQQYASYLGLVPGEDSSGEDQARLGITKAGNRHLRMLLVEAAQNYGRGKPGYKSKQLKKRQEGNPPEVIAYADKANERLRRKYYRMVLSYNKRTNVAKVAVARELACFIWGMMTGNVA